MKKGNIIASILCILLGAYIVITCLGYPKAEAYGTGAPGPGMWPGIIGGLLIAASLWLLISTLRAPKDSLGEIVIWGDGPKRVYVTMALLVVYVLAIPEIGFIPLTILLLFIFINWFAKYKWYLSLIISVAVTLLIYVIFKFALSVPIDFGMIAF